MIFEIVRYVIFCFSQTIVQLTAVFGGLFLLAYIMYRISDGIRKVGVTRLGKAYYFIVAPGVACHELGHALGCYLTGIKVEKIVLFTPLQEPQMYEKGVLGYVSQDPPKTFLGLASLFFSATGPIWFGCLVIIFLSYLMMGGEYFAEVGQCLQSFDFQSRSDFVILVKLVLKIFIPTNWTSPFAFVGLYLIFCIASEISLSPPDINCGKVGFLVIAILCFVLNLCTGGPCTTGGIASVSIYHPILYTIMLFAISVNFVVFVIFKLFFDKDE